MIGEVREKDNVSFIFLVFFRVLKLKIINFFLSLLSLKDINLKISVFLRIDIFLKLLSLNREKSVKVTYLSLYRILKHRFLDYLLSLLIDFSIDFFANYFADCLVNILFLLAGRGFLNLRVILIIYYRK